jgi:hypothetical protein
VCFKNRDQKKITIIILEPIIVGIILILLLSINKNKESNGLDFYIYKTKENYVSYIPLHTGLDLNYLACSEIGENQVFLLPDDFIFSSETRIRNNKRNLNSIN